MAMKILLLTLVMALMHGAAQECSKRSEKASIHKLRTMTRCSEPQDSLVQLPVPAGFDYVKPDVTKVKQCTALSCQVFPEKCLPKNITLKVYKVNAHLKENHTPHCVEVKVEEHSACECRCEKIGCPCNRIFNHKTCECECHPKTKSLCDTRRVDGERVMWSETSCSCLCDRRTQCDSSMIWVEEQCRCVEKNLDSSNEA